MGEDKSASSCRQKNGVNYIHTYTLCLTDIDECGTATHNCHGVANCYNNEGSFTCQCRDSYIGDGILNCDPLGE